MRQTNQIYCNECHKYVDVIETKCKRSVTGPERMLTWNVCIDCGHQILSNRPSTPNESRGWTYNPKISLDFRVKQDLDDLKGKEEPASDFINKMMRFLTSNKTRYREFREYCKSYNRDYPPSDYSEDDVRSP